VEQGEKSSRVPLHSIITQSSDINLVRAAHGKNFDFYMGEATEGEIFMLILGGLH
jgi:hypothetical protein